MFVFLKYENQRAVPRYEHQTFGCLFIRNRRNGKFNLEISLDGATKVSYSYRGNETTSAERQRYVVSPFFANDKKKQ